MTRLTIAEKEDIERKRKLVIDLLKSRGQMFLDDIVEHFNDSHPEITRGTVSIMSRIGLLQATQTDKRSKNGHLLPIYSVKEEKKLSPSKRKKAEDVKRRQDIVLKHIKQNGSMTMNEILDKVPEATVSSVGHMIKLQLLRPTATEKRNKNGNIIYTYSIHDEPIKNEPKPRELAFYDIFPTQIPKSTSKPRVVLNLDSVHTKSGMSPKYGGLQSSMMNLINLCGE